MPPPRTHPARQVTEWDGDPWFTPEERKAWDDARKAKWLANLSKRDKLRIMEAIRSMKPIDPGSNLDDLDAYFRVGIVRKDLSGYEGGVEFKELDGWVLKAFRK